MTSSSIVLPVGLLGVVKTTISGRALAIAPSARSVVTSYGSPTISSTTVPPAMTLSRPCIE